MMLECPSRWDACPPIVSGRASAAEVNVAVVRSPLSGGGRRVRAGAARNRRGRWWLPREPLAKGPGPAPAGSPTGSPGGRLDEEPVDLAKVGGPQQQGDEDALGGHPADPPALGITQRLPGPVLQEAVHPLVGAPQGGVGGLPIVASVEQRLGELGPGLRWHGDALLGADRGRVVGDRGGQRDPQPALGARADRVGFQVAAGDWCRV